MDRAVTYATYVLDYRPLKSDPYRARITVGGDKLQYLEDAGSPASNIIETKLLINSVISDTHKGAFHEYGFKGLLPKHANATP